MSEPVKASELTASLSAASKKAHSRSNSILQARLVVLFTDRALYGRALGCFFHVFRALEAALTKCCQDKDIQHTWASLLPLFHTKAFEEDLEYYLGPSWQQQVPPGSATQQYVAHLQDLANTNPTLLLAHAYTQHIGMVSGGQIVKRMARKQMGLPEDKGTATFDFPQSSPSQLKATFFTAFNQVGDTMTPALKEQMISEHLKAFKFNNAIISEFSVGWWPFFRGLVLLLPPMSRVSILLLAAVVGITYYRKE